MVNPPNPLFLGQTSPLPASPDEAVLDYLFRRVERDLGSLTALLERLDRASLAAQRRITVPFLRGLIGSG